MDPIPLVALAIIMIEPITVITITVILIGGAIMATALALMIRREKRMKDAQASAIHSPLGPVPTPDQNNLLWSYKVTGLYSELNSFRVGPIDPDITTSNMEVDVPRWTGTRSGQFVVFKGTNLLEGVTATGSFQTSADSGIGTGAMQATIFVDIIPATRGARDITKVTYIPTKR